VMLIIQVLHDKIRASNAINCFQPRTCNPLKKQRPKQPSTLGWRGDGRTVTRLPKSDQLLTVDCRFVL